MSNIIDLLEKALKIRDRISPKYSEHTIKLAVDEMMVLVEDALTLLKSDSPPIEGKTENPDPIPMRYNPNRHSSHKN